MTGGPGAGAFGSRSGSSMGVSGAEASAATHSTGARADEGQSGPSGRVASGCSTSPTMVSATVASSGGAGPSAGDAVSGGAASVIRVVSAGSPPSLLTSTGPATSPASDSPLIEPTCICALQLASRNTTASAAPRPIRTTSLVAFLIAVTIRQRAVASPFVKELLPR